MKVNWEKSETVLSAAAIIVGAAMWLGVLNYMTVANADDITAVKADVKQAREETPAKIAVLQTDVKNLKDSIEAMRVEQREANKELIDTIRHGNR